MLPILVTAFVSPLFSYRKGVKGESLIELPSKDSNYASFSTGLCDYFYCNNSTTYTFGVLRGGTTTYGADGGTFCFSVRDVLAGTYACFGFRSMLVLS